jgi:hypothetical protein
VSAVDHERAWYALKARLRERRSWGADQVLVVMSECEVDCLSPETEEELAAAIQAREDRKKDEAAQPNRPATTAAA